MRKLVIVAVVLSIVGVLIFGGSSAYRSYRVVPHGLAAAATTQPTKRDPAVHDFEDADYAQKMLLYHQLAVELDNIAISKASQPEVRQFAERNNIHESAQASVYSNLLKSWGESYLNLTDFPEINGCHGYPTFSGMLPHVAVRTYRFAEDGEVDKQFLALTIKHHADLASLVRENGRLIGFGELIQTRDKTLKYQNGEIQRLKTMLGDVSL